MANNKKKSSLKVRGFHNFYFDSEAETWTSLQKKGWNLERCKMFELTKVPLKHNITAAKQNDVIKLLEIIYGKEWRGDDRLKWYDSILKMTNTAEGQNDDYVDDDAREEPCDCLDDDCGVHI